MNATGKLYGDRYQVSYEIPLWPYAAWIQSVVNGEGPPDRPPPTTGPAPTTSPAGCDPGDPRCHPDPVTPLGILVGPSTTNGQVLPDNPNSTINPDQLSTCAD